MLTRLITYISLKTELVIQSNHVDPNPVLSSNFLMYGSMQEHCICRAYQTERNCSILPLLFSPENALPRLECGCMLMKYMMALVIMGRDHRK